MPKYRNQKMTVDGITFDSQREARRYQELRLLERSGEIKNLERQVRFQLLPNMKTPDGKTVRGVTYIADFAYYDKNGAYVVEDAKGYRTKEYILKKKMLLRKHGYWIEEV